jgi:hypothetical protein
MAAAPRWCYFFFLGDFFFRAICGPGPSSKIRGDALRPFFLRVAIVTLPPFDKATLALSLMCEAETVITDRLRISRPGAHIAERRRVAEHSASVSNRCGMHAYAGI